GSTRISTGRPSASFSTTMTPPRGPNESPPSGNPREPRAGERIALLQREYLVPIMFLSSGSGHWLVFDIVYQTKGGCCAPAQDRGRLVPPSPADRVKPRRAPPAGHGVLRSNRRSVQTRLSPPLSRGDKGAGGTP